MSLVEIAELQSSIRSLVNERRDLQERLSRGKRRGVNKTPHSFRGIKRERSVGTDNVDDNLDKIAPKKARVVPESKLSQVVLEVPSDAFPVEKRPQISLDDSAVKRNRNLFGSLLGHLQKAKTVLDHEKTTKSAELHKSAENQVSQKLDLERRNLAELRRRDMQDRQLKDLARMRKVQIELMAKENEMLITTAFWSNEKLYSYRVRGQLFAKCSVVPISALPMIFWVPATHNKETKELQENTQRQIETKIDSVVEKFKLENNLLTSRLADADIRKEDSLVSNLDAQNATSTTTEPLEVHPDLINDDSDEDDDMATVKNRKETQMLHIASSNEKQGSFVDKSEKLSDKCEDRNSLPADTVKEEQQTAIMDSLDGLSASVENLTSVNSTQTGDAGLVKLTERDPGAALMTADLPCPSAT